MIVESLNQSRPITTDHPPRAAEGEKACRLPRRSEDHAWSHSRFRIAARQRLVTWARRHLVECQSRWRSVARVRLGCSSPSGSRGRRPPLHRTRTIAPPPSHLGAASEARLGKDGRRWRWLSSGSTWRRPGWTCMSCQKAWRSRWAGIRQGWIQLSAALTVGAGDGGGRGRGRPRERGGGQPGCRWLAGRGGQPGAGALLRQCTRQAGEDGSDRCCPMSEGGDRPVRPGDQAGDPAAGGRRHDGARRPDCPSLGATGANHPDDHRRGAA